MSELEVIKVRYPNGRVKIAHVFVNGEPVSQICLLIRKIRKWMKKK